LLFVEVFATLNTSHMSIAELFRPQIKEPIHIPLDQEARLAIANLAQQVLDLHIREVRTSPDVVVMHGKQPDKRPLREKRTKPYLPKYETVAYDRSGIVSMHVEETPVSLYLYIDNATYPPGEDSITVEFTRRPGAEDGYTLVDGPKLANGLPAPADLALSLTGEGQTLVDLIRQA
jgi:hypothetical protein